MDRGRGNSDFAYCHRGVHRNAGRARHDIDWTGTRRAVTPERQRPGGEAEQAKEKEEVPAAADPDGDPGRAGAARAHGPRGAPIIIPALASGTAGPSSLYPNTIEIEGFANGVITDVDLMLLGLTHDAPQDIDLLLIKDDGRHALLLSEAGSTIPARDVHPTLDDEAPATLPQTALTGGSFRPADFGSEKLEPDNFLAPAPSLNGSSALSIFDGANPNGAWRLFVMDDAKDATGEIRGWGLRITAEVDTGTVQEQVAAGQDGKKSKNGRQRGKK